MHRGKCSSCSQEALNCPCTRRRNQARPWNSSSEPTTSTLCSLQLTQHGSCTNPLSSPLSHLQFVSSIRTMKLISMDWEKLSSLTLAFNYVSPQIGDTLRSLLGWLWGEHNQSLILVDHITERRPVMTAVLRHSGYRKPVLCEASSFEHLDEAFRGSYVVFDKYGDDLRRVGLQESLDLCEHVDGRLLNGYKRSFN